MHGWSSFCLEFKNGWVSLFYHVTISLFWRSLLNISPYTAEERASSLLVSRHSFHRNVCRIIREVYPPHAGSIKSGPLRGRLQFVSVRVFGSDEGGPVCLDRGYERVIWWAGGAPDSGDFGGVSYA
jgi:hypothetical protein